MQVVVDPYVVLSILDHHQRRSDDSDQVRGLVIGKKGKGVVRITNFVPTMSDLSFVELTLRSCPGDSTLGWYATDPTLATEIDRAPGTQLFIGVQTPDAANPTIDVKAFQVDKLSVDGHDIRAFRPVPCEVAATTAPCSVAVDTIVRQVAPEVATASDPSVVSTTSEDSEVFAEFQQLRRNLKTAQAYCAAAADGKVAGDAALGRTLSSTLVADLNALSMAPNLSRDIETTSQDSLMLSFVMKLLAQKVSGLRDTYHDTLSGLTAGEDE